jgi:hypothetical protein
MLQRKENINDVESLVLKALKKVYKDYMSINYRMIINKQKPERLFNAELYHQLRNLQTRFNSETYNFSMLKFHIDLNKVSGNRNHSDLPCIEHYRPTNFSPDLIIHNSQNDLTNQLFIAEIKMDGASTNKIIKDLTKLLYYKTSFLKFKNAAFIYTGSVQSLKVKLESILEFDNEDFISCLINQEIVFFCRESTIDDKTKEKTWNAFNLKFKNI